MKNFPEDQSFEELGKRLEGYTEQPDDLVWTNINATLRPRRIPLWAPWIDRISAATGILMVAVLLGSQLRTASTAPAMKSAETKPNWKQRDLTVIVPHENTADGFHKPKKTDGSTALRTTASSSLHVASIGSVPLVQTPDVSHEFFDRGVSKDAQRDVIIAKNNAADSIFVEALTSPIDSFKTEEVAVKKIKRPKRGLSFYFSVTPQLSFQRVTPVSQDGIVITDIFTQPIFSGERLAINLEVGVQGKLTSRLEYYGGISVFQHRQTLRYEYQSTSNVNIESTDDLSYSIIPQRQLAVVEYAMLNVGANAGLLYHLQGQKLAHKVGAGLSYQYGSRKNSAEENQNSSSQYLFYQLHYRSELPLSQRLKFFLQPSFSHSFYVDQKLDAPFKLKPYRAGLGVGLIYRL